jgi:hypothetical protein
MANHTGFVCENLMFMVPWLRALDIFNNETPGIDGMIGMKVHPINSMVFQCIGKISGKRIKQNRNTYPHT